GGVQSAREVGREQLSGGEAVRLQLTLDPNVMLPQMPVLQRDLVEHQLWVYTRTLKPARFAVQVIRQTPAQADKPPGDRFHYELVWEFDRPEPVAVPDEVRTGAQDVGAD
ncbi:MAG TPA: hypothetical protein VD902_09045, partial [Symbiobacteriaceae bacterium]|nr:hypothetical protein [Symbiobacteriaceae bacterium]